MTANFVSRRLIRWVALAILMTASPLAMLSERPVYAQTSPTAIIEVQGAITALTNTTLVVNGLTVDISTAQKRGTLAVGTIVKIEGTLQADGTIKARQVKVVTDTTAPQENELTGSVESITGDVMVVSGQSFNIASAEIGSGVVVGVRVKVHFTVVDGVFIVREVNLIAARRDDRPRDDRAGEDELTGTVESITGDVMVIAGQSFNTASAEIGSGVVVGAQVKVHYTVVDGVNVAREVRLATDPDRDGDDDNPHRGGGDDGAGHDAGDDHGGHGGDDQSGHGGRGGDDGSGHR